MVQNSPEKAAALRAVARQLTGAAEAGIAFAPGTPAAGDTPDTDPGWQVAISHVLRTAEPVVLPAANELAPGGSAASAWCGVPLPGPDGPTGVLWVAAAPGGSFAAPDLAVLQHLAVLASHGDTAERRSALDQSARLAAETSRAQAHLLLALSEALTDTETAPDVAAALDRVATAQLGVTWSYLGLTDQQARRVRFVPLPGRPGDDDADWDGVPLGRQHPAGHVAVTGTPLVFTDAATMYAAYPDTWDNTTGPVAFQATVHLPLTTAGQTVGTLTLAFDTDRVFSLHDQAAMLALARYTAQALHRAQLLAERRSAATTLQLAMLTDLPEPDHFELKARYLPSDHRDQVGGDWYDAFISPDGATTMVVGDVTGHNIRAAAGMGQLRSILRAYGVDQNQTPAELTARLDRAIDSLAIDTLATLVVARLEQTDAQEAVGLRRLRWTNAGHTTPVVLHPDGTTQVLETPSNLLVGLKPDTDRHDHTIDLAPGATVLLYTDGLIERRGIDLDDATEAVARRVRNQQHLSLDQLLDHVLHDSTSADDDIVVLALRLNTQH